MSWTSERASQPLCHARAHQGRRIAAIRRLHEVYSRKWHNQLCAMPLHIAMPLIWIRTTGARRGRLLLLVAARLV